MEARPLRYPAGSVIRSRRDVSGGGRHAKPLRERDPVTAGAAFPDRNDNAWLDAAEPVQLAAAVVHRVEDDEAGRATFVIVEGEPRAQRAASCIVMPMAGDVVLIATRTGRPPLIIAVLTRASNEAATISVPEAAGLQVAAEQIALVAQSSITATASKVDLEAEEGRFQIAKTHFLGDAALLVLNTMETLCTNLHSYAQRLVVKAGYALRVIDEVDSSVASTVLVQARQTYSLQSTQTLISSTHDTRIDGERISMG